MAITPHIADVLRTPGAATALETFAIGLSTFTRELSKEILDSFTGPLYRVAAVAGALATTASIVTLTLRDGENGKTLIKWFLRLSFCLALFASLNTAFGLLESARKEIGGVSTPLVQNARTSFDDSYGRLVKTRFADRDSTTDEPSSPIWDPQKPWYENVNRTFNPNDWRPSRLYAALTIGRAALTSGDLLARVIWAFILLAMRLAGPFVIIVSVDTSLSKRIASPYAWGLVVVYFIWPVTSDILSTAGYLMAGMTARIFTGSGELQVDARSMGYAVSVSVLTLFIAAFMQFGSIGIAYRLSRGRVFEGVGATVFNWLGSMAGSAAEYFGIKAATDMEMLARMSEVDGAYRSSITVAKANREASLTQARSGLEGPSLMSRAGLVAQTSVATSRLRLSLDTNRALRDASVRLINNSTALKLGEIGAAGAANLGEVGAHLGRELQELSIEESSAKRRIVAQTIAGTYTIASTAVGEQIRKALIALATGGAGAAAGAAEVASATSTLGSSPPAFETSVPQSTYGAAQAIPGLQRVSPLEIPGLSPTRAIGEQPFSGERLKSPTLDEGEIRRLPDKGGTRGSLPATIAMGAFNFYNTGRVAGEHIKNLDDYTGKVTGIINTKADTLINLRRAANAEAVNIYTDRGGTLTAAATSATATRQSGVDQAYSIQRAAAATRYDLATESVEARYRGQTGAAEITKESSTKGAAARREAAILRESTRHVGRMINANQLRL